MAIGSGKVYFDDSTAFHSGSRGKLYVDDGGVLTVLSGGVLTVDSGAGLNADTTGSVTIASGGTITVESGGTLTADSGAGVHITTTGEYNILSGGYIDVKSGANVRYPVVGCTSSYIAGSGTSNLAAIPNNGIVFALINGTSSRRHVDIAAPVAGVHLKVFCSPDAASSSGGLVFDCGTGITIDSTNRMFYWASSGSTYGQYEARVELVGISASRWSVLSSYPGTWGSSGWLVGASTA